MQTTTNVKPSTEALPTRRVLTVKERQSLTDAANVYGYADVAAQGGDFIPGSNGASPVSVPWLAFNRPRLNAQQKQVMKVLKEGTPEHVSGPEKDKMSELAEELKEVFTKPEYFQSRAEVRVLKRDKPEYFTALEKARRWQKPIETKWGMKSPMELAEAYRNIKRTLEPDDEFADSLDKLRADKYK